MGFVQIAPARPDITCGNKPIHRFVSDSRLLIEIIEAPNLQHNYMRTA